MPCRFPRKIYAGRRHSASAGNQKPVQVKPFKSNRSGQRKRARSEENLDFGEQRRVAFDAEPVSERQHLGVAFVVHQRQFHLAWAGWLVRICPSRRTCDWSSAIGGSTIVSGRSSCASNVGTVNSVARMLTVSSRFSTAADLYHGVDGELGRGGLVHLAEEHALDGTFQILDGYDGPRIALFSTRGGPHS